MKKKEKKKVKQRLPKGMVEVLRTKGGPHSTQHGEKGYDRKKERQKERREEW